MSVKCMQSTQNRAQNGASSQYLESFITVATVIDIIEGLRY